MEIAIITDEHNFYFEIKNVILLILNGSKSLDKLVYNRNTFIPFLISSSKQYNKFCNVTLIYCFEHTILALCITSIYTKKLSKHAIQFINFDAQRKSSIKGTLTIKYQLNPRL